MDVDLAPPLILNDVFERGERTERLRQKIRHATFHNEQADVFTDAKDKQKAQNHITCLLHPHLLTNNPSPCEREIIRAMQEEEDERDALKDVYEVLRAVNGSALPGELCSLVIMYWLPTFSIEGPNRPFTVTRCMQRSGVCGHGSSTRRSTTTTPLNDFSISLCWRGDGQFFNDDDNFIPVTDEFVPVGFRPPLPSTVRFVWKMWTDSSAADDFRPCRKFKFAARGLKWGNETQIVTAVSDGLAVKLDYMKNASDNTNVCYSVGLVEVAIPKYTVRWTDCVPRKLDELSDNLNDDDPQYLCAHRNSKWSTDYDEFSGTPLISAHGLSQVCPGEPDNDSDYDKNAYEDNDFTSDSDTETPEKPAESFVDSSSSSDESSDEDVKAEGVDMETNSSDFDSDEFDPPTNTKRRRLDKDSHWCVDTYEDPYAQNPDYDSDHELFDPNLDLDPDS